MSKVSVENTLLKQYTDKELVHYIRGKIDDALNSTVAEEVSPEAALTMRLTKIGALMPLLRAVDDRMNGSTKNVNIVV